MAATAAAAEFGAADRYYFNASFPEERIGVGIAVIGHHYAWFKRHNVITVIPLLALGLVRVASSFYNTKLAKPENFFHDVEKWLALFADRVSTLIVSRIHAVAADLIYNLAENGNYFAVAESEYRIQMHRRTAPRHQASNHACCSFLLE